MMARECFVLELLLIILMEKWCLEFSFYGITIGIPKTTLVIRLLHIYHGILIKSKLCIK